MLAVLAAVFALAGAPAATPFVCFPKPPVSEGAIAYGLTFLDESPARIEVYGAYGCAALWYAGASEGERRQLERLNPKKDFADIVGVGLLVDLHEAFHVGLDSRDECRVEKAAIAGMPRLLAGFRFKAGFVADALFDAREFDAGLAPAYHGC